MFVPYRVLKYKSKGGISFQYLAQNSFSHNRSYSVKSTSSNVAKTKQSNLSESQLESYRVYYKQLQSTISNIPEEVAAKSQPLITLHKRLSLPKEFTYSNLARCLTCRSSKLPSDPMKVDLATRPEAFPSTVQTNDLCDNYGLNIFGKNLLTFQVTNYLLLKYPRLPTVVLNAAIDSYISQSTLANIARSWGVEIESTPVIERFLKQEPVSITLGKLRYFNNVLDKLDGIELLSKKNYSQDAALALFVRSVVGVLWTIDPKLAENFIRDHILSRKLDVTKLFQFEHPTRELARLCEREGLMRPVSKLLAESGRLSKAPVFIIGVFSGDEKLGEGVGASLKEAKARAASDALMKWYCYEPALSQGQKPVIDHGTVIV